MALKFSGDVRNARLDAVEVLIDESPKLQIRTGAAPANCAAADSGTVVIEIDLPVDWMDPANAGAKAKKGVWSGAATGVMAGAGHFRIKDSTGTTTHIQGSASVVGDAPDMVLDNNNVAIGQTVTVSTFTLTDGNA